MMNDEEHASHHSSFIIPHSAFIIYYYRGKRERVDRLLVERGLAPTRTRAQALVMAGLVLVGDRRVEKPSESVEPDAPLRVRGADDPTARYVGRGGLKMEKALEEFRINPADYVCLDVG